MQTESAPLVTSSDQPKSTKKWSTLQVIMIVLIAILLTGFFSNLDRIIEEFESNKDESDSSNNNDWSDSFGHDILQFFELDTNYTEFNSGSIGNSPTYVIDYQLELRREREKCPTGWSTSSLYSELLSMLAEYLGGVNPDNLAFIINASHGMNAVLRSIASFIYNNKCRNTLIPLTNSTKYNQTCKILQFSTAYPMVQQTINFINNNDGSPENQLITFDISIEMLSNTTLLISELREFIEMHQNYENGSIYMATFGHIAAYPSVLYNIKELIELFREYDIYTAIDGAHAMGQIQINLTDINPDIWLSNGHKWLFSTRGSAVIYVSDELVNQIHPVVISSSGFNNNDAINWQRIFNYQGTMSREIFITMKAALEFRQQFGDENITNYNHNLCINAGKIFEKYWNKSLLITNEENIGSIINPILPTQNPDEISQVTSLLRSGLYDENGRYTIIPTRSYAGVYYARICCQFFLELSDFEWLAQTFIAILDDIKNPNVQTVRYTVQVDDTLPDYMIP